MTNVKNKSKTVITDQEVQQEFQNTENLGEFQKLRAKATLALLETGKRRSEIVSLELSDVWSDNLFLYVRFTVVKKRKKNIRSLQRVKKFNLQSVWAKSILDYITYLKKRWLECRFLYPYTHSVFGLTQIVDHTRHSMPQLILRILKTLNPDDWPHQHRERRAVKVIRNAEAKRGSADLNTVYQVRDVLDLERETTAYNYIRRFQTQRVEEDEEAIN